MKPLKDRSSSVATRWGVGLLLVLAMVGLAVGFAMPSAKRPVAIEAAPAAQGIDPTSSGEFAADAALARGDAPNAVDRHEFALAAADASDSVEAPSVAVDGTGRVYLAWASQTADKERTLYLATSADHGKSYATPRDVMHSPIFTAMSEMGGRQVARLLRTIPHLSTSQDDVWLAWNESHRDNTTVHMVVAKSADQGETFSEPRQLHASDAARPTFTWLRAAPDGTLAASWLDNRSGVQQVFATRWPAGAAAAEEERLVAAGQDSKGVCPCCPTSAAIGTDGSLYVAFRNQIDGYRDIWVSRLPAGATAFEAPRPVVEPRWKFDGCPHDGPSLVVEGDRLHVAWMDGHSGRQRVYHAVGGCLAGSFEVQELNVGSPGSQGNVKLCFDDQGTLHAIWEESAAAEPAAAHGGHGHGESAATKTASSHHHGPPVGGSRAILHASLAKGNTQFSRPVAIAAKEGAFQTRPDLAAAQDGELFVVWNELGTQGKRVVIVRVPKGTGAAETLVAR